MRFPNQGIIKAHSFNSKPKQIKVVQFIQPKSFDVKPVKITNLLKRKIIAEIPITFPLFLSHNNRYHSNSEEIRVENILKELVKIKTFIDKDPKNQIDIVKEFLMNNGFTNEYDLTYAKIMNFIIYLRKPFKIDREKNMHEIITDALNYDAKEIEYVEDKNKFKYYFYFNNPSTLSEEFKQNHIYDSEEISPNLDKESKEKLIYKRYKTKYCYNFGSELKKIPKEKEEEKHVINLGKIAYDKEIEAKVKNYETIVKRLTPLIPLPSPRSTASIPRNPLSLQTSKPPKNTQFKSLSKSKSKNMSNLTLNNFSDYQRKLISKIPKMDFSKYEMHRKNYSYLFRSLSKELKEIKREKMDRILSNNKNWDEEIRIKPGNLKKKFKLIKDINKRLYYDDLIRRENTGEFNIKEVNHREKLTELVLLNKVKNKIAIDEARNKFLHKALVDLKI